jgi:uncharacterized protein (TIGR03067 family)
MAPVACEQDMKILLILGSLCGAMAQADERAEEFKKLQGDWEGYVVEGRGERPDRGPIHLRLTIKDSSISAIDLGEGNKDMGSGTCTIDSGQGVKQLDATGIVLPGKRERTFLGIYEVEGDTLRWCVDNRQKQRPSEFRTNSGNYLLVLKRKK